MSGNTEFIYRLREHHLRVTNDAADIIEALEAQLAAAKQAQPERAPNMKALYEELLYAVARKFPDETRHQTALRYIKHAEERSTATASNADIKQGGQHD